MSHLRPNDKEGGGSKGYADYTDNEKQSALAQITDDARAKTLAGKKIAPETAKLAVDLAKDIKATDSLSDEVKDAAGKAAK
jgi:hypothetical protein